MNSKFQQEYDRIAGSRLARLDGGIPKRVALGDKRSIRFAFKMKRLGLKGNHIDEAIKLIDEISINEMLENHTIGVRFSTIPRSKTPLDIWQIKE